MHVELWQSYSETRDISLRNKIIEQNLPLVKYVVTRNQNTIFFGCEYDDLVSYGTFGLIKAVEKYDLNRKIEFSTFAYQKIYFSIIDELRKVDWVPRSVRSKIKKVRDTIKEMEGYCVYDIDKYAVAQSHGLSALDINVMEGTAVSSMDVTINYIYEEGGLYYDTISL